LLYKKTYITNTVNWHIRQIEPVTNRSFLVFAHEYSMIPLFDRLPTLQIMSQYRTASRGV